MLCAERDSLRQEHRIAVQNFRASIRELVVLVDNSASDFNLAHWRIRTASHACEVARDALEHHQVEHGCRIAATRAVWCQDRDRLLHEHNSAAMEFSRVAWALTEIAGTSSARDYRMLNLENDRAKARLRKARDAYVRHIAEHGCAAKKVSS